jgi:hypothetical protein
MLRCTVGFYRRAIEQDVTAHQHRHRAISVPEWPQFAAVAAAIGVIGGVAYHALKAVVITIVTVPRQSSNRDGRACERRREDAVGLADLPEARDQHGVARHRAPRDKNRVRSRRFEAPEQVVEPDEPFRLAVERITPDLARPRAEENGTAVGLPSQRVHARRDGRAAPQNFPIAGLQNHDSR